MSVRDRNSANRRWRPRFPLAVLVPLSVVVFCAFFLVRFWDSSAAEWLPSEPHDEANRVVHPSGFSIVIPRDWEAHVYARVDWNRITASPGSGSRSAPFLIVSKGNKPIDVARFDATQFLGSNAWQRLELSAGSRDFLLYELAVKRNGTWFQIIYGIQNGSSSNPRFKSVPKGMWPYLKSFQSSKDTANSTTQPVVRSSSPATLKAPKSR